MTHVPHAPAVTYRLQLHGGFTFSDAEALATYLAALGVTDCYVSPVSTAMPGSTHGYDVCRHSEINPELGGRAGLELLAGALKRLNLGLLVDFVPNHMSNDPHTNDWWRDVLENGPSSPFARCFDIDWDPVKPELKDRLLLPILGEPYGDALERGLLTLRFDRGTLVLDYGDLTLPINPRRSPLVLEHDVDALQRELGPESPALREFLSILTALRNLPPYIERDPHRIAERHRERQVARDRLLRLAKESSAVRAHVDRALAAFNGTPGQPDSFDPLHQLLELQAYRLASWRTAADEINYRRFFDINQLAGLRVEDRRVFEDIHRMLLELVGAGLVTGIRLDHIDGLFDPRGYLVQLAAAAESTYLVVEKILSRGESLPADWPVAGTTGYTFLNDVNGLFVDGRHAKALARVYSTFTGRTAAFADVAYESKRLIVSTALASEFQVLAQAVNRLSERDRRNRDFTLASIRRALREIVACFPVYRTYVTSSAVTAADEAVVDSAIAEARRRNPALESSIFDFLREMLLPGTPARSAPPSGGVVDHARFDVAMRFHQYTAPVQAKGIEDTAFYRYHLLASLNEVGGDPGRVGRSVAHFHAANDARHRQWPRDMLATTTHDTKRGEDARARISVLSEIPNQWREAVSQWKRLNGANRTRLASGTAPDRNDEYLFYQSLVGAWPVDVTTTEDSGATAAALVARMGEFMRKAIREAKVHTSWITPNDPYERGVQTFVERTLTGRKSPAFLESFVAFLANVAPAGVTNSLAQVVLKVAAPGVPDFYQGTELWDLSLVDPDNRRPVDWNLRRRVLESLDARLALTSIDVTDADRHEDLAGYVHQLLEAWPDARIKCFVTACGMRLRRARPHLFIEGDYEPLAASGPAADHVVAFARCLGNERLVAIVPRLTMALASGGRWPLGEPAWQDTSVRLPPSCGRGVFRDLLSGQRFQSSTAGDSAQAAQWLLRDVFASCPVALLWREPGPS